jgi:hypothetical protein
MKAKKGRWPGGVAGAVEVPGAQLVGDRLAPGVVRAFLPRHAGRDVVDAEREEAAAVGVDEPVPAGDLFEMELTRLLAGDRIRSRSGRHQRHADEEGKEPAIASHANDLGRRERRPGSDCSSGTAGCKL